ncbi:MAG TPA: ferritin [Bacteroidia bacterium]|jgi:ferritin|nr:ferritin [Bacteroidia bacterium]
MLSKKVTDALNKQIELEASSSQYYLAMASWAETQGLKGVSAFLYKHADEERMHMLKLIQFVNERGSHGLVPALKQPPEHFKSMKHVFNQVLEHEVLVTKEINHLVDITLKEKDYTTHNFLQWYVSEQIEEESLARDLVDKLKLVGDDKGGLYFFDRDLQGLTSANAGKKGA